MVAQKKVSRYKAGFETGFKGLTYAEIGARMPRTHRFKMHRKQVGFDEKGTCVCSRCGETVPHKSNVPCRTVNCPKCGSKMKRKIDDVKQDEQA